ncbi:MAG: helix-turn-helix domain-containing protein [Peptococcales bacterium]|jgi:transcriptional regulator with XRE-family HTH domain
MTTKYSKNYKEIGKKISYYRKQSGLTQQDLADLVGISKSYLSKIEAPNTNKSYSLDVLFGIAEALKINIKDLF